MSGAEEKKKRALAKGTFTRNLKNLNAVLDDVNARSISWWILSMSA
jgi:hypothetical protein